MSKTDFYNNLTKGLMSSNRFSDIELKYCKKCLNFVDDDDDEQKNGWHTRFISHVMHPAGRHLNAEISPFRFGHQVSLGHVVRHVRRQYHVPVTYSFIVEKRDENEQTIQKQPDIDGHRTNVFTCKCTRRLRTSKSILCLPSACRRRTRTAPGLTHGDKQKENVQKGNNN